MKDIKTIDSLYHACTYGRAPVVFERGRGARLWDDKGRDYIGSGIGVMSFGYANPEWVKAVSEQAAVLPHTSNLFYNEKTAMLAGRLALRTHFERVFLSNSGAEANECLIKTARKWASDTKGEGEHPFVTLVNSFHRSSPLPRPHAHDRHRHGAGHVPQVLRALHAGIPLRARERPCRTRKAA